MSPPPSGKARLHRVLPPVEMGALIGIVIQLTFLAIGLMITLVAWTVRLMVMLIAALVAAISSES